MVRPRFFAGQLLTEDDLQSLQDYTLAKNRLHNRHLFGAGVVCGLEVLCDPCGGGHVAVQPGYALDCCGNDIVLDCKLSLDINAMVRDLRRDQLGGYDCGDPCSEQQQKLNIAAGKSVENPLREYCLYVRYCETESDPVSPYAVDEPCSGQSCEASRIREGIRFELRCPAPASPGPELITAILHCFQDVIGIEAMSVEAVSLASLQQKAQQAAQALTKSSYDDLRARLLDLIDRSPHLVKCNLRARVLAVPPPVTVQTQGAPIPSPTAPVALIEIFLELFKECICMALNPPCAPCDDTGVLLACLKLQDCAVVEICNMQRHFVITPTALRYWLSFGEWERLVAAWCCGEQTLSRYDGPSGTNMLGQGMAMRAAPQTDTASGTDTVPKDPLPEMASAIQLKAIANAIGGMQPAGSLNATRILNVGRAFGALGGEIPMPPPPPPPPMDEVSDAARKVISRTVADQVKAAAAQNAEDLKKANDQIAALQDQVKAILAKSSNVRGRRAAKKEPGGSDE
jgi:hypothetical protein